MTQIDRIITAAGAIVKLFEAQFIGSPCKLFDSIVLYIVSNKTMFIKYMYLLGHKTYLIKRGKVLSLSSNFFQGFVSFSELFQLLMQLKKNNDTNKSK